MLVLGVAGLCAQDELADQLVPKASPVDELAPQFSDDSRVISHSGQFKIAGSDAARRGTAANLAEETKQELLRLTEEKDEWKVPIIVELRGKRGDIVPQRVTAMNLWFSEQGYELRLLVNLSRDLQRESFKRAVTSALIYERGLRDRPKTESEVPMNVPQWLIEGLQEASAWRLNQADRRPYETLFLHGGLFKPEEVFALSEAKFETMDAASKSVFRVFSGALTMALLEQPEGKKGMREFLAEVPAFQGEMPALLRRHFPDLNLSEKSLAKWWALQLAAKGTAPLTDSLSVAETERLLDEGLRLRYLDAKGILHENPLAEWQSIAAMEEQTRIEAVRLAQDDLLRLSYRCFPSYRILLLEYQALLTDLAKGKTKDIAMSIQALDETRQTMIAKAEGARDFLDWFEITRARETSGAFDDYLNLKSRLKARPNHRADDMSKYLDRFDPLFVMPEERSPLPMNDRLPPF
ncbi:MAG: hypothetical protein H7Y36_12420 [Armatimonadetes bacterium]|nr:hypothetical protein [Akkermansiaceae bacterium]